MLNYLKADMYRIIKGKDFIGSMILCLLFQLIFSYIMCINKTNEEFRMLISVSAVFIPLFSLKPLMFFWGSDFTARTINNLLIKSKNRLILFLYKTIATILFGISYLLISLITAIAFFSINGVMDIQLTINIVAYQLPFYLCIILLGIFLFNYIDSVNQACVLYLFIAVLFDNIASFIIAPLDTLEFLREFLLFNKLKDIPANGNIWTMSSLIALIFSGIYFLVSYYLFQTREFK